MGRFLRIFLEVFGVCWLVVEPLALWRPNDLRFGLYGYFGLGLASLLISLILSWPKTRISGKLAISDTTVAIEVGDLLDQKGNIIIGVPDTFDTELGDIISPKSLQGQWQQRFFADRASLDALIERELSNVKCKLDRSKISGKNQRYPNGTTIALTRGDRRYFLVAYTRMRPDLRVESDICMLANALNDCWKVIRTRGANEPIHMGVIGSGLARIGLSRSLLIQFIVLSFLDAQKSGSLTRSLTIHVPESDSEHVHLAEMQDWLAALTRIG